jgi:hypothetical protein
MSSEPALEQIEAQERLVSLPFPETGWRKWVYGLFVVISQGLFFWVFRETYLPFDKPSNFSDYATKLLFPKSVDLFFLLVVCSTICFLILFYDPARTPKKFIIRFGVYTGILLTFHYCLLWGLLLLDNAEGFGLPFVFFASFPWLYLWAIKKWNNNKVNTVFLILLVMVFSFISFSLSKDEVIDWLSLLIPILILGVAAPYWLLLLLFRAGIWVFKNYEIKFTTLRGLVICVWIAIYIAALRFDIF